MNKSFYSDPKGRKFLSAAAFGLTIVILIALNILRAYIGDKFPQYLPDMTVVKSLPEKLIIALMIVFASVYIIFIVILLPMWYKTIKYTVTEHEIVASSGLFSRTKRIMKLSSVQNASRISFPRSDITCFNFISLNALGGRIVLMFLSDSDCAEIMESLSRRFDKKPAAEKPVRSEYKGKYSVMQSDTGDYEYRDNSDMFSRSEIDDFVGDFSEYKQLSFTEMPSDSQLSFDDTDRRDDM